MLMRSMLLDCRILHLVFNSDDLTENIEPICDILRKNKIKCGKLDLSRVDWSAEQCLKILNTVKAITVEMDSERSHRFEALYQSKTLVRFIPLLIYRLL